MLFSHLNSVWFSLEQQMSVVLFENNNTSTLRKTIISKDNLIKLLIVCVVL